MRSSAAPLLIFVMLLLGGCSGEGEGPPVRVHVPHGASFSQVTDSLASKGLVRVPLLFRVYARSVGVDDKVQAGTYGFRKGTGWGRIIEALRSGDVLDVRLVIPEGWDLRKIAPGIAQVTGGSADSILEQLSDSARAARLGVPGPTLEGYLYPATYTFPVDAPLDSVLQRLVAAYRTVWTPDRRARADSMKMSEREVVTLASIVEKEAKRREEMPLIAAVYHNRLRIGIPLQADPTVQYAAGVHRRRLTYAHIDSVADSPYNTYRRRGLPPGPIGSPSALALDATLRPANAAFLYFVAKPDGSHVFTRSLDEHNRAKAAIRRAAREAARANPPPARPAPAAPASPSGTTGPGNP